MRTRNHRQLGWGTALVLAAACGRAPRDAPRPIGPYPGGLQDVEQAGPTDDDDNDGISNDRDNCPLAYEPWSDPVRDGCPATGADAGVALPGAPP